MQHIFISHIVISFIVLFAFVVGNDGICGVTLFEDNVAVRGVKARYGADWEKFDPLNWVWVTGGVEWADWLNWIWVGPGGVVWADWLKCDALNCDWFNGICVVRW